LPEKLQRGNRGDKAMIESASLLTDVVREPPLLGEGIWDEEGLEEEHDKQPRTIEMEE
jgi:hypothetical protein